MFQAMIKSVLWSMASVQAIVILLKITSFPTWHWLGVFMPTWGTLSMFGIMLIWLDWANNYMSDVLKQSHEQGEEMKTRIVELDKLNENK